MDPGIYHSGGSLTGWRVTILGDNHGLNLLEKRFTAGHVINIYIQAGVLEFGHSGC